MAILNEKGLPYLIQGPPVTGKIPEYWNLKDVKYINFENYGGIEVQHKKVVEVPRILPKEPLRMPEVVTPQKVEIRIGDVPKVSVSTVSVDSSMTETEVLAKIKGLSGAPVIYQESVTKEEYKVYARALDLQSGVLYCDKTEFNLFYPKEGDGVNCDFINARWTIREVTKIGSIVRIKVK
jgi:hypothetical protein